jgi:hypothetical protein
MSGEQMPPLYFYIIYFIFKIFNYSTFVARMFSAIIGTISIISMYQLGKEIYNKKVGLISALFLSINIFHIYYSQEARPYGLFLLFTIISFYRLLLFLKATNLKNTIYYSVFSGLLVLTHFFGLFVLVAQAVILLFYLFIKNKEDRKLFFKHCLIYGAVVTIMFLPAVSIFIKVSKITEFWIQPPALDVYTSIYKEFFGNSELLLPFFSLSKIKKIDLNFNTILINKKVLCFTILFPWIFMVILLPIIRSYLSTPMIISRYFIVLLPAIIIILAIGIIQFKNKLISGSLLFLLTLVSLTDIIVIKKYYTTVNKAQFREVSNFVNSNINKKEPLVSSLGWYLPFFINSQTEIIDKSLDSFIEEMKQDPKKIKSFWYLDAHGRSYTTNQSVLDFINENFYIENNYDAFQAWTKHFVLINEAPKPVDLSKYKTIEKYNGDHFKFNIENFEILNDKIRTSGWAYFENQKSERTFIDVLLIRESDKKVFRLTSQKVNRPDVTSYFKNPFNVDNSGFESNLDTSKLENGNYVLALYLLDNNTKKEGLILTDKVFKK